MISIADLSGVSMTTDKKQPLDADRLLRLQRYEQQFDLQRMGSPDFARISRWAPHRPWRATLWDNVMALLGALILVAVIVACLFF
jgi:hypothetical protein